MTDITKLPDEWRVSQVVEHAARDNENIRADERRTLAAELEAALPTWTRITEDESTWPEVGAEIMMADWYDCWYLCDAYVDVDFSAENVGAYWQPLCDLDYPPEEES